MPRRMVLNLLGAVGARLGLRREWYLILLAAMIGVLMGIAALAFMKPIQWLEGLPEQVRETWGWGARYLILGLPAVGAVLTCITFILVPTRFRGHGVTTVMYAVSREKSQLPFSLAVRHWFASTFTIGSGGSAGPEGPIVTIGASIGSSIGRRLGASPADTTALLGCGAAAGLAAVFNAPLAGIFFVLEVLLRDFSLRTFTPIVVAAVMSATTAQTITGGRQPIFGVGPHVLGPQSTFTVQESPSFAVLGVVVALVAVGFMRAMRAFEQMFHRMPVPRRWRPVAGGMCLGILGLGFVIFVPTRMALPPFYGHGYAIASGLINGTSYPALAGPEHAKEMLLVAAVLLAWMVLKVAATGFTVGSGGAGGLFAPTLVLGAIVGGAFGAVLSAMGLLPGPTPAPYALVGMACMVAATTHAPLTGMMLVYELTQSYEIMLPLMLATVVATILSNVLNPNSIYTAELSALGVRLGTLGDFSVLRRLTVKDLGLDPAVEVRREDRGQRLQELSEAFHVDDLVVVDEERRYLGAITAGDLRAALVFREALPLLQAGELERSDVPMLHEDDTLDMALERFNGVEAQGLPVVDRRTRRVLGMVSRRRLMQRYTAELERSQ